ncbi:MAG TPA: hypothetical protein VGN72_19655 [Tepidisphaeraceae bacterium]|jgi:hypothetical protein|nr:hypothetical protein [Tepidisphaeraceae bacterium]
MAKATTEPKPVTLDTKYFRITVGDWMKMSREDRLADTRIGDVRIKELDELITRAGGDPFAQPATAAADAPADGGRSEIIAAEVATGDDAPPLVIPPVTTDPAKLDLIAALVASQLEDADRVADFENAVLETPHATLDPALDVQPAPPLASLATEPVKAVAPRMSVGQLIDELEDEPAAIGYVRRSPAPKLTSEQANLQSRIHAVLVRNGVELRDPSDVYGWLLDQIEAAVLQA